MRSWEGGGAERGGGKAAAVGGVMRVDGNLRHAKTIPRSLRRSRGPCGRRNQPALVCSALGDGLSAVVCAAFLASATPTSQSSGDVARDGLQQVERRRGPLVVELDDLEALEAYCAGLPIALRTPPSRPRLLDAKLPTFSIESNPDNPFSGVGAKRTLEALDANNDEPLTPKGKVAVSKQARRRHICAEEASLLDVLVASSRRYLPRYPAPSEIGASRQPPSSAHAHRTTRRRPP